jgi:hypothetical protein
MRNGKKVEIVIESRDNENPFLVDVLQQLEEVFPANIKSKKANNSFREEVLKIQNVPINFAVGDYRSFRLEENASQHNSDECKAICSFNKPGMAQILMSPFEKYFKECDPLFV